MKEIKFLNALKCSHAFNHIKNDLNIGLGHAYMVVSPDDEIVSEFFTLTATTIFCSEEIACLSCGECLKVLHDNHSDIINVNEQKQRIKVGEIKDILSSVSIKSLGEKKIFFINRADLMSVDAQNKLLKTLEEPPKGVTIFLGVSNESGMLDTINSRCRKIFMDKFDADTIFNSLLNLGVNSDVCAVATACSEGMIGKAYKIALSPDYTEIYNFALNLIGNLKRSRDILALDNSDIIQKNTDEFFNILTIIFRDMLVLKSDNNLVMSKHLKQKIQSLSDGYSARAIAEIILNINEARKKINFNVNSLATVDNLLFSILEVKYKWQ